MNTNFKNIYNLKDETYDNPLYIIIPIFVFLLLLIILVIILLSSRGNIQNIKGLDIDEKTSLQITYEVFIAVLFIVILFGLLLFLLPSFSKVKEFLSKMSFSVYLIIYTIMIILFLISLNGTTINNYGYIIGPIILLSSFYMFYSSFNKNYIKNRNLTYERIKTIIVFFCFLALFSTYYNIDPGNYIKNYANYSILLTLIMSFFIFMYLILLIIFPSYDSSSESKFSFMPNVGLKTTFLPFSNFSKIYNLPTYSLVGFILFIVGLLIGIYNYPGGFLNDKYTSTLIIILTLIISIIWVTSIIITMFPITQSANASAFLDPLNNFDLYKNSLLILFGLVIGSLFIAWLAYNIQRMTSGTGYISFFVNFILLIMIVSLIYNLFTYKNTRQHTTSKGPIQIIKDSLVLIPSLFKKFIQLITLFFSKNRNISFMSSAIVLIIMNILLIIYYYYPSTIIQDKFLLQGGKLLVNQPIYTNTLNSISSYQELNNAEDSFNYKYGISFWVFFEASSSNNNLASNKFSSILNYGNKPNILYKANTNTLMVIFEKNGVPSNKENNNEEKLYDYDENGNKIIYKTNNILLQKWNHIVVNYDSGTLDIFINNELVKSSVNNIPYMSFDTLTVGEENGYAGGLCNLTYFNKPLTSANIYYLYKFANMLKQPVVGISNATIVK